MTDLIIQPNCENSGETIRMGIREGCRSPVIGRYGSCEERPAGLGLNDLKHSKSDDLILQSAPVTAPEISHGISEASLQIQRDACVVYEQDLATVPLYFSDSETVRPSSVIIDKPPLKITGDFGSDIPSRRTSQYICDQIDPEDSIRDIISENDFYRFVLFKRHYEKYLDISKKYEEARNIAYYLEERYHEIKAERDSLSTSNKDLEGRIEKKEAEIHEKEDELFLQLEKAIRLEEDCEKLKSEKERIVDLKFRLEKEKNELYKKLKLQADESEANRRRLERARNDVVRRVTEISSEKDQLERENVRLRDALEDIERRTLSKKTKSNVEQQLMELKMVVKQSATLNSQLKKGMKHLASCRRRKCSVCAYTRSTFGDYSGGGPSSQRAGRVKLFSCLQGDLGDKKSSGAAGMSRMCDSQNLAEQLAQRLSSLSLTPHRDDMGSLILAYADDESTTEEDEEDACAISNNASLASRDISLSSVNRDTSPASREASLSSSAPFSSDSGFSDPSLTPSKSLRRTTTWTSSFRRLIRKVKRHNT